MRITSNVIGARFTESIRSVLGHAQAVIMPPCLETIRTIEGLRWGLFR